MHEVIHLSFGPQANELNGLFYNTQQSYFVYSKEDVANSHVDPSIRFVYGAEYTPRAAFWDYRNGFAHRRKYNEKYEEAQPQTAITDDQERPVHAIATSGTDPQPQPAPWATSSKVPLHPRSMNTIPDWEFDVEQFPYGHQRGASVDEYREFETFGEGADQFQVVCNEQGGREDYLDATVRPLLEKCDLVDGVNLVTDLAGWAGFTAPYLETLRDEYIPKGTVFTWALSRKAPRFKYAVQQSRLEALAAFAEHSSLVLPLQDTHGVKTAADFTKNNLDKLPIFESTALLSSLRRNRVSMQALCQDLTIEVPGANIVQLDSSLPAKLEPLHEFANAKKNHAVRNTVKIVRSRNEPEPLKRGESTDRSQNVSQYWCPQPLEQTPNAEFRLQITDAPLKLRKFTERRSHELRELIFDLTEPYIWQWDLSDDSD